MTVNELLILKNKKITELKREELSDITAFDVSGGTLSDRISCYVKNVKNPYCFRVKATPVKIVFSDRADAPAAESALVNIATRRFN